MSSVYAVLAWGIDLGPINEDKAKTFAGYVEELSEDRPRPTWDVYSYGDNADSWALCLARSVVTMDQEGNKDASDFLAYHFEGGDFSLLSQPSDDELSDLGDLVKSTPGATDRDDLYLLPLLLPCVEDPRP